MKNFVLIIIGTISVILGFIGLFLPVMPTTIFLMAAGLCYINSSKKLYQRLIRMKYFGSAIESYVERREVTRQFKISSLLFLYIPSIITQVFIVKSWEYRVIPIVLLLLLTWHILSLKTIDKEQLKKEENTQHDK